MAAVVCSSRSRVLCSESMGFAARACDADVPMEERISIPRSGRAVKLSSSQACPRSFWIFGAMSTARCSASVWISSGTSPAASALCSTRHVFTSHSVFFSFS